MVQTHINDEWLNIFFELWERDTFKAKTESFLISLSLFNRLTDGIVLTKKESSWLVDTARYYRLTLPHGYNSGDAIALTGMKKAEKNEGFRQAITTHYCTIQHNELMASRSWMKLLKASSTLSTIVDEVTHGNALSPQLGTSCPGEWLAAPSASPAPSMASPSAVTHAQPLASLSTGMDFPSGNGDTHSPLRGKRLGNRGLVEALRPPTRPEQMRVQAWRTDGKKQAPWRLKLWCGRDEAGRLSNTEAWHSLMSPPRAWESHVVKRNLMSQAQAYQILNILEDNEIKGRDKWTRPQAGMWQHLASETWVDYWFPILITKKDGSLYLIVADREGGIVFSETMKPMEKVRDSWFAEGHTAYHSGVDETPFDRDVQRQQALSSLGTTKSFD